MLFRSLQCNSLLSDFNVDQTPHHFTRRCQKIKKRGVAGYLLHIGMFRWNYSIVTSVINIAVQNLAPWTWTLK